VTTLAKLTGDQRVGKMFAVLLVALTEDGKKFFTKYLPGGTAILGTQWCIVFNKCFAIGHGLSRFTIGWPATWMHVEKQPN
jgi:hypothetical protein